MMLNTKGAIISENDDVDTNDIYLPNQSEHVTQIAVDIGGSLAKVVWFSKSPEGGRLNFVKFETVKIDECIEFVGSLLKQRSTMMIRGTGGGSHKYHDLFEQRLGVRIQQEDEMECLITGLNFLVRQIAYEVFTYDERRPDPMEFEDASRSMFPYMLVNIGSGVSIIKVTSEETYERISGTSFGGGTLWGLLSLLTDAKDYDEMLELSKLGDNKNVDMLVGDIYGGAYDKIGLKSTTIASSFGKVFKTPAAERKSKFKPEDMAVSLLYLVSNTIGQIAYLNAQAHGIQRIYFSGFFIRGHPVTMNALSYAISFWSKGKIKALFLRHEGYLGAVGAFLRDPPEAVRANSFKENFSHTQKISLHSLGAVGALDSSQTDLTVFPLLKDPEQYKCDTSDLKDPQLQNYWIDLLDMNLQHLVDLALKHQGGVSSEELAKRADRFASMYRAHLKRLRKEPNCYGLLTVRGLLNLREQCLREMGFTDIFHQVKLSENKAALMGFPKFLQKIDSLKGHVQLETLLDNILAGNMYDWGSQAMQKMLESGDFNFALAKEKVGRPAQFNHVEKLKKRLVDGKPYKKAIIFVDNSGSDLVFGILPFVRFLLLAGTEVILAANTYPSVNDITAVELEPLLKSAAQFDHVLSDGLDHQKLHVVATGSGSPCLDLRQVSEELAMVAKDADLVVIEGMGRAIHTNFFARFVTDVIKIGVFKNPQIAKELGAQMFDGVVLFE
ncbi:fumble-domain-containing protein [Gorgonomyces haynaldii]|nr:fumble-domain-containing protein [Gorgonomyces haynaldii]